MIHLVHEFRIMTTAPHHSAGHFITVLIFLTYRKLSRKKEPRETTTHVIPTINPFISHQLSSPPFRTGLSAKAGKTGALITIERPKQETCSDPA